MMTSLDPFALSFDSIKVEPKTPAAQSAQPDEPGFYLLDDAGGRFSIDQATGIVTLAHDHVLETERGAIHPVQIKVIEHSGARYELNFRLRVTGRVPQLLGTQENDALASLTSVALLDLMQEGETIATTPTAPVQSWIGFSASAQAHGALRRLGSEHARFGTLLETRPLGTFDGGAQITLGDHLPAPAQTTANWLI